MCRVVELVDEGLEALHFALHLLLSGQGPRLSLGAQLLEPVAENALLLLVKGETLKVTVIINLINDAVHVELDVVDHFVDLLQSLLDLALLDLANLHCVDTLLLYGLQVDTSHLLNVRYQVGVVTIEGFFLGLETLRNTA